MAQTTAQATTRPARHQVLSTTSPIIVSIVMANLHLSRGIQYPLIAQSNEIHIETTVK